MRTRVANGVENFGRSNAKSGEFLSMETDGNITGKQMERFGG